MRGLIVSSVLICAVGQANADGRIDQLVKGYTSEQTSCRIHESGIARMADGASMLLEHSSEDGLAGDVATLHAAHETVASYCTALASAIDFLKADPSASYKSLEKQLGERDSHIRTLRADSKKAIADTEPLISKWIPKINAMRIEGDKATAPMPTYAKPVETKPATKPVETKPAVESKPVIEAKPAPTPDPTPAKPESPPPSAKPQSARFPSGHSVKLPSLGGKWTVSGDPTTDIADYVENDIHTTVTAEKSTGVSCNAQLVRLQAKAYGRQATKEKARAGQAWQVRLAGDAPAIVACAATRTGSALVTFDATDGAHPDLSELAWTMLASFAK